MKIGQEIKWIEQEYWSTKHPDECGYTDTKVTAMIVSFDIETVIVSRVLRNLGRSETVLRPMTIAEVELIIRKEGRMVYRDGKYLETRDPQSVSVKTT